MSLSCHHLRSKAWLAAALVVAAYSALAPSSVEAACGDYVLIGGQSIRHSDTLPHLMLDSQGSHPALPCRCSGPTCSNNDQQFPGLPPATGFNLAADWGMLSGGAVPAPADCRFAGFHDDLHLPRLASAPIFHPPR
jgi:hypothetical protein